MPSGAPCSAGNPSAHPHLPSLAAQPRPSSCLCSPPGRPACPSLLHRSAPPTTVRQSCLKRHPSAPCSGVPTGSQLLGWPSGVSSCPVSLVPASPGSNPVLGWSPWQALTCVCWEKAQLSLLLRKPPSPRPVPVPYSPPGHITGPCHPPACGRSSSARAQGGVVEQTGPGLHQTPPPSTQLVVGTGPLPPSSGLDCTPCAWRWGGRAGEASRTY